MIARAKSQGLSVSLDPSWDETLIRDPALIDNCRGVDLFLPNAEEAAAIARTDDPDRALDVLSRQFPQVVLKQGADGAVLARSGECHRLPAPRVDVVDTTGAGDLFAAGFLAGQVRGRSLEDSLRIGSIAAAEVISHFGARPEADLIALVEEQLGADESEAHPS